VARNPGGASGEIASFCSSTRNKLHSQWSGKELASLLDNFVPDPMDIVMGRGRFSKNSTGHFQLGRLVQERQEEYDGAKRAKKAAIDGSILRELRSIGCRFVRSSPQGLEEVQVHENVREKISHPFRNAKLKKVQKRRRKTLVDATVVINKENVEPFSTKTCL
jgi:hypothetical protein